MLTEHSIKTGPSGYGALCNCSAHRPVKPDLSVPVTGSPPALSSLYSSPAAQEAKAGPIVPEPGPALDQNLRLAGFPHHLRSMESIQYKAPRMRAGG